MARLPRQEVTFTLLSAGTEAQAVGYRDRRGRAPFENWYGALDVQAAAKVAVAIQRLVAGNRSEIRSVGAGVMERRIHWGPGYRVYFGLDGPRLVVLLGGGTKSRQQRDIVTAHARWADYKTRRDEQDPK